MAVIKADRRTGKGSRDAKHLRAEGNIPAIIYGHGQENESITLREHDLELAVLHGERLLELDVQGATENVLIKEIQYDTFGQEVLHVDFTRVNLDERVEVTVPVVLRGTPAGHEEGGILQQVTAEIEIECLVTAIPDEIRHSVNQMKIGDTLHAGDLVLPEGATLIDEPETVICSVTVVAEEEEAPAEEGEEGAQPEVIGAKPDEDEEGEEAEARE